IFIVNKEKSSWLSWFDLWSSVGFVEPTLISRTHRVPSDVFTIKRLCIAFCFVKVFDCICPRATVEGISTRSADKSIIILLAFQYVIFTFAVKEVVTETDGFYDIIDY
ncbi:MAG TPA: hypothetical protein VJ742_11405, partial [Nitrososphaera sp.]|nr:hypothetical protein [Nitrososphaera sp.]